MKAAIFSILNRFPRLKRLLRIVRNRFFPGLSVSSHYISLNAEDSEAEGKRLRLAWQNDKLPKKQRALVEKQLAGYRAGDNVDVFDVFVDSIRALPDIKPGMTLLEVGCSSGFYSEVLDIAQLPLEYSGCDYSSSFIQLAREKHPYRRFSVADATNLDYPDNSFDIVVSGCCLLHIPDYVSAVKETERVTRRYAIFHRTPVVWGQDEQWYRKQAYGVETVEIHFNEKEFLDLLESSGLILMTTYTLHKECDLDDMSKGYAIRTYICRKKEH